MRILCYNPIEVKFMIKKLIICLFLFLLTSCGSSTKTTVEQRGQLSVIRITRIANTDGNPGVFIYAKNDGNRAIKNAMVSVYVDVNDNLIDSNEIYFNGVIEPGQVVTGSCYFYAMSIYTYYESILFSPEFDEV